MSGINFDLSKMEETIVKVSKNLTIESLFNKIEPIIQKETIKSFESETRPRDRTPWKPSLEAIKYNRPTLQKKGDLFREMQSKEPYILNINDNSIEVRTKLKKGDYFYGRLNNFGVGKVRKNRGVLPERQFAGISPEGIKEIKRVLLNAFKS